MCWGFITNSDYRNHMMMSVSKLLSFAALFFFVLFSFMKLSCCTGNSTITCPEIEKQSLLSFKQSLQVLENNLFSWSDEVDCCNWEGVLCSNITGHVDQLSLRASNSDGQISPSLLNLKYLKHLDLEPIEFGEYGSSLRVDSLEWLSGLSKLEYLSISDVNLSRASQWQQQVITKLPSLVELHLSGCSLNNTDPLREVNNIATYNLTIIDLSLSYSYAEDGFTPSASVVPRWIFLLSNLTHLDLSWNNYEGSIPSVSNTTKLQYIDLSSNMFNSSIPEWLYTLKDLEYLNLEDNNIQGAISNSISNLTSLNILDLGFNELSGKLPSETTNLCKLLHLDLQMNKLEGEISDSFENISNCFLGTLEFLSLSNNKLSGHLSHRFGEFKKLQYLDLSSNSLSCVIPVNLGNLSSLQELDLQNNKLTGNLPETIGQLSKLVTFSIEHNKLEGIVTENHFANLSSLETLYASGNQLTLKVSPNWIPSFELSQLELGSWNLGSRFPSWLHTQNKRFLSLDLSNTGIHGNVPNWIWSLSYIDLRSNKLCGQLPDIPTLMFSLDLSSNLFSGDLSHFLCNTTTNDELENLNLGGNRLTGELPNCFIKWPALLLLNLSNNNLHGRIPDSVGFLSNLKSLNLYGNNFSGNIPFSIQNCKELVKMDLSSNRLSGNLPKWIMTDLSNLAILIVKYNKLSGEITSDICQLNSLQIIDLSDNMFSGKIPRCFDNFTAMITGRDRDLGDYFTYTNKLRERASVDTKGKELTYDTYILTLVTSIDLSRNNLSGGIPEQITSLVELRTLNLSGNRLTGKIPNTIGNMKNLECLDFSINSLSGELPNSFTAMSSLDYLNVSYNKLTGRIPECTQLQSFNESSFVGNNLCGPPLPRCEAPGTTHMQPEDEGSVKPEIEWLYVFTSLGFAVGLSATLTTLFLKRSWREAYYEFIHDMMDSAYVYALVKWRKLKSGLGLNM